MNSVESLFLESESILDQKGLATLGDCLDFNCYGWEQRPNALWTVSHGLWLLSQRSLFCYLTCLPEKFFFICNLYLLWPLQPHFSLWREGIWAFLGCSLRALFLLYIAGCRAAHYAHSEALPPWSSMGWSLPLFSRSYWAWGAPGCGQPSKWPGMLQTWI